MQRVVARGYRTAVGQFGHGGRSSVSGLKVALFGGTGFLGRYVANEFGKIGSTAYVGTRGSEMEARHLKPMFDLGNLAIYYYDGRDEDSIRDIIRGADLVVNLVGKTFETKHVVPTDENGKLKLFGGSRINWGFDDVHVTLAERIARIAKEEGAENLIHVSALTADAESSSAWCRSKGLGEDAVRAQFPTATIVRPATLFGYEDWFLNWYAWLGERFAIPLLEDGSQLVQPVHVADVAKVIADIAQNPEDLAGQTVELAGPADYTRAELAEFVKDVTRRNYRIAPLPAPVFTAVASMVESLPTPYLMKDFAERWSVDEVLEPKDGVLTFDDFEVEPATVEKIAFQFLHRYRKGGHFVYAQGYH
eukprot:CAMPEP_0118973840 /NCGR_PEP_ID=MMETSP1173-20130426/10935_1 /TAXON_ID=1034831 /ORGANISM="Rhizochromulina marina cf, Strain CCMP1243" /LENGTH=362 /DNA_ID=CAMNT_0006923535 /DNA_START=65 /DNA_END=1153 /DNA_ORIENTATION=-